MTTQAQICNLALAKLGDVARVVSIAPPDGSMQANYCALFYSQALNVLLSKHAWSFATQTVALSLATSNNNPLWNFAFQLPDDYYDLVEVRSATDCCVALPTGSGAITLNPDRALAYECQGGVLYSNSDAVVMVYLSTNFISEGFFTPLFAEALAVLLSVYLAGPLIKGDIGVAAQNRQMQLFTLALRLAVEADCKYRRSRIQPIPAGIGSR